MDRIDPFLHILPNIDVHGYTEDMVMTVVNEFIYDCYKLGYDKIYVIHGKGYGILKRKIHSSLKHNRKVKNFYLYNFNTGCTIIELVERR